jgi:hypothetical protein
MMPSPQVRGSRVGPDSPLRSFFARKFARSVRMNHSKSSSFTLTYTFPFTITISKYFPGREATLDPVGLSTGTSTYWNLPKTLPVGPGYVAGRFSGTPRRLSGAWHNDRPPG